jgi:hypothetical protein
MSKRSVFCISNSRTQAAQIADGLRSEGYSDEGISTFFPDGAMSRDFADEKGTKAAEVAATGVGTWSLLGDTLGWLAATGRLLSGAAVGAAVGCIAGALIGMGIPEHQAKLFGGKVGPLISADRMVAALSGAAIGAAAGGIAGATARGHHHPIWPASRELAD